MRSTDKEVYLDFALEKALMDESDRTFLFGFENKIFEIQEMFKGEENITSVLMLFRNKHELSLGNSVIRRYYKNSDLDFELDLKRSNNTGDFTVEVKRNFSLRNQVLKLTDFFDKVNRLNEGKVENYVIVKKIYKSEEILEKTESEVYEKINTIEDIQNFSGPQSSIFKNKKISKGRGNFTWNTPENAGTEESVTANEIFNKNASEYNFSIQPDQYNKQSSFNDHKKLKEERNYHNKYHTHDIKHKTQNGYCTPQTKNSISNDNFKNYKIYSQKKENLFVKSNHILEVYNISISKEELSEELLSLCRENNLTDSLILRAKEDTFLLVCDDASNADRILKLTTYKFRIRKFRSTNELMKSDNFPVRTPSINVSAFNRMIISHLNSNNSKMNI